MKIYRTLSLVALLAVFMISCTKSDVEPAATEQANTNASTSSNTSVTTSTSGTTNPPATRQTGDTVYAYQPGNSGAMGAAIPDSALAGNWTLVSDSTSFSDGESAAFNSEKKYTGQPGDYFNITSDGNINLKEGPNSQAIFCVLTNSATNSFELLYTQYPNAAIAGSGFIHAQLLQPVVTANSATLTSKIVTPGGIFYRQFTLKK